MHAVVEVGLLGKHFDEVLIFRAVLISVYIMGLATMEGALVAILILGKFGDFRCRLVERGVFIIFGKDLYVRLWGLRHENGLFGV